MRLQNIKSKVIDVSPTFSPYLAPRFWDIYIYTDGSKNGAQLIRDKRGMFGGVEGGLEGLVWRGIGGFPWTVICASIGRWREVNAPNEGKIMLLQGEGKYFGLGCIKMLIWRNLMYVLVVNSNWSIHIYISTLLNKKYTKVYNLKHCTL